MKTSLSGKSLILVSLFISGLTGCWHKPAPVKKDEAVTKASDDVAIPVCENSIAADKAPEKATLLKDVKELIDGKEGKYVLRSVQSHYSKELEGKVKLSLSAETAIEEGKAKDAKVICASLGKEPSYNLDISTPAAFARKDGVYNQRNLVKITVNAAKDPEDEKKNVHAAAVAITTEDVVDKKDEPKKPYGLGEASEVAIEKAQKETDEDRTYVRVYRTSETEIIVRVTKVKSVGKDLKITQSSSSRYEIAKATPAAQ